MNVLVYSGPGVITQSVKHCMETLKLHLSPYYAVMSVSEDILLNEPWMNKTSLLVFPGGADLPFCQTFNGAGNKKIQDFVKKGGKFIGFCAGGYYGSSRCEFMVGDPEMEISGSRELAFFPGTAKGCVYNGFKYNTSDGARVTPLQVNSAAFPNAPNLVYNYYNGGGLFVNASKYDNVEVLARYTEPTDIEDDEKAAIVYCKYGKGEVLLAGTHPEYSPGLLKSDEDGNVVDIVQTLSKHDEARRRFNQLCLLKMGMRVNEDINASVPKTTPIYLACKSNPSKVRILAQNLKDNMDFVDGNTFEDSNDTFRIHEDLKIDASYVTSSEHPVTNLSFLFSDKLPPPKQTPYFNMSTYYSHFNSLAEGKECEIGSFIGYGEVVTSTSTLIERNSGWLKYLPNGFTLTATTQVEGRGRGGNVWVNPKGVLASSFLLRVPHTDINSASIVMIQYLCSLATITAISNYGNASHNNGCGYEGIPVKIKWPNDLYVMKPEYLNSLNEGETSSETVEGDDQKYAKIAGALVNTQFLNGEFFFVCGQGVNVSNEAPSTSLNMVLEKFNQVRKEAGLAPLPPFEEEKLLARMLFTFDRFYEVFRKSGLTPFLSLYYKRWFHNGQIVTLDSTHQNRRCIIKGINEQTGILIVEDIRDHSVVELQPDGNSFDVFKGLIYKK